MSVSSITTEKGKLFSGKFLANLPTLLMTSLSTFIIITTDSWVVSTFAGKDALAAIGMVAPFSLISCIIVNILLQGIPACLVYAMGKNDPSEVNRTLCASYRLKYWGAILTTLFQIPLAFAILNSYETSPEIFRMAWIYAIGIMVGAPFGLYSTLGMYELQSYGKLKSILSLTLFEGILNLLLDLLFSWLTGEAITGVTLGTLVATICRCVLTVWYQRRHTDVFKFEPVPCWSKMVEVIKIGFSNGLMVGMLGLQNWLMTWLVSKELSDSGLAARSVCILGLSVAMIIITSISTNTRMLTGLLYGAGNHEGVRLIRRRSLAYIGLFVGLLTTLILIYPESLFYFYGYDTVDELDKEALRIFSLFFPLTGFINVYVAFFNSHLRPKTATIIVVLNNAVILIPLALLMSYFTDGNGIWWSYPISAGLTLIITLYIVLKNYRQRNKEQEKNLYITIKPNDGCECSMMVTDHLEENGVSKQLAYRAGMLVEEICGKMASTDERIHTDIELYVGCESINKVVIVLFDNGKKLNTKFDSTIGNQMQMLQNKTMDERIESLDEILQDDLGLAELTAKKVNHSWVWGMNYVTINLEENDEKS